MTGRLARALRYAVVAVGALGFVGALAVLAVPSLAGALPVEAAIEAAGSDYQLLAVFGGLAAVALLGMLVVRAVGRVEQADPPTPETVEGVPVVGSELDAVVADGLGLRATLFSDEPDRLRERLREEAVRTLMRVENCPRAQAERRVDEGSWTDDAAAAAFLAGGRAPVRSRLAAALRGRSWLQHGTAAAATAIATRAEGNPAGGAR
ncbi:DUF7269 family protein [Halomarina ordinaria]|uniref:Alkaline shock response membrane anchor protein AmaP n=1 Tax=Halomarina ordinaria TaxID=3033939 RepID=A0ABD5UDH2_9EURY|nr:hypothetical protein [Halomarina sp. PSRA2]